MHRFIALYSRPSDVDAFRNYYTEQHLPLVRALPGVRRMSYSFDVAVLQGDIEYACAFEADFDDRDALLSALQSPEGAKAAADLPNFATAGVQLLDFPVATA